MDRNDIADNPLVHILNDKDADPTILTLSLIEEITKNFTCGEIGRGGFAVVYKGVLGNGGTVAVKKLSENIILDEKAYIREVGSLMKVKHDNIVRFLGYCADTQGQVLENERTFVLAEQRKRLLCFEYVPNGSLEKFIPDVPGALDWRKRYKIIKGICAGLHYLHEKNILHLDLKPANILLDDKMMPKISDFGLARCFNEKQIHATTKKQSGTLGYLAPESFNDKVTITKKWDMYSLGVIIEEILTGHKGHFRVQDVLAFWRNVFETSSLSNTDVLLEQVRVCAEISTKCLDRDPAKRPRTQWIMEKLYEIADELSQELLQIHPFALRFPFEQNKEICCPVNLTNETDSKVYFAIEPSNPAKYAGAEGLRGVVLPHSTQAVCVTMLKQKSQPSKMDVFRILISTSRSMEPGAGLVVEETLRAFVSDPSTASAPAIIKKEVVCDDNIYGQVESMDVHPTEPWIVTAHSRGYICIWKMKLQQRRNTSYLSRKAPPAAASSIEKLVCKHMGSEKFTSVKFIPRTVCVVSGDSSGFIHVYTYIENRLVEVANDKVHSSPVTSLAVHPTRYYMLSSSDTEVRRRDWDDDKGWVCVREWSLGARQVLFNPKSAETIAMILNPKKFETRSIAIWSASNPETDFPSQNASQSTCLAYYLPPGRDTQYLVIGHSDGHTEILDGRSNKHLHALKVAMSSCVVAVACHPTFPLLVTGTEDGNVYLWNCTTNRLTQTLSFEHGTVMGLGFIDLQGFKR